MGDIIGKGAEAELTVTDGRVRKERIAKGYRHPEIDERLRKERTENEARLLEKAERVGIKVPDVLVIEDYAIEMELVEGEKFRDVFENEEEMWKDFGRDIGRLHSRNIIHGDLTTSNVILKEGELYFIDFGLGFFSDRTEDRATDLRLLSQVLDASHHTVSEKAFGDILEGYSEIFENSEEVLKRLEEMEGRTRYG